MGLSHRRDAVVLPAAIYRNHCQIVHTIFLESKTLSLKSYLFNGSSEKKKSHLDTYFDPPSKTTVRAGPLTSFWFGSCQGTAYSKL